jgi:hypothetical protein
MRAHAETEVEYKLINTAKHCHGQQNLRKLQATSFGLSSKPSSHLSNVKSHTTSLHLHVVSRSHSLTTVIKTHVKIHTSCVKLKGEYKNCSFK